MIVTVNISDKSFSVSVDEGRQTFKWLAGVIASRAKASQILRQDYEDDAFIVSGIKNVNGELIDPVDMIMEHSVGDSVVVTADIMSSFESDEWGNPIRGDWMTAGYVRSDSGKIWTDEMTAWRERLETPSIAPVGSDVEVPIFSPRIKSSLVQIGEEFSLAEVESAFSLDVQLMSWTWAERMPPATLQIGQKYGMTPLEFSHLLHFCRMTNLNKDAEKIDEIFRKTSRLQGPSATNGPVMTRAHFAQALVCTIMVKDAASQSEGPAVDEDGEPVSAPTSLTFIDPSDGLRSLFTGPISSFWSSIRAKYFLYTCTDPLLHDTNHDYLTLLKGVYLGWATVDSFRGAGITLQDFIQVMKTSSVCADEQERACIHAFWASQLDPTVAWELESLCFSEFVEALTRLAMKTIDAGSQMTEVRKLRLAYSMLVEMEAEKPHK